MWYDLVMSITTVIQIRKQADSVVSGTNGLLISDFGSWRHKERDTILTMLTILSDPNAQRILWCLRSQLISTGRDPKNLTATATVENSTLWLNGRNSTLCLYGPISTDSFSKFSNSKDHLFRAWRHPHSSLISCLGGLLWQWWLSYPSCTSVKLHPMTMHLNLRDSNSSKPIQTEW